MKELKYFNICSNSNIINNEFHEYINSYSNSHFIFSNDDELMNLIEKEDIHFAIVKYDFEMLKRMRNFNKQIQIIAILEKISDLHLLEVLELEYIKIIENISCINEFSNMLKDCIRNIDSKKSNLLYLKNNFTYDMYNKTLFQNKNIVPLTKKELSFLDFMLINTNNEIDYKQIAEEIWEGSMTQDALRSLIKELRKKTYKELIKNVSGIGYRIDL